MPRPRVALLTAAVLLAPGALVLPALASTPSGQTLTVPPAGRVAKVAWSGTVPVGSNPQSSCQVPGTDDQHALKLVVPAAAARLSTALTVSITWTPPVDPTASDLVLTLLGPDGKEVDSSDGGDPQETVGVNDPAPGTYTAVACGFVNAQPTPYKGSAVLTSKVRVPKANQPTVARGLAFGPSTPSDVQRSIGEPAVTTDLDGNMYTCGPSGFSNIADYANVSTDGGDQFHLLGQPPRGQLSGGEGGGDCALATAIKRNPQGKYALAYAGLGPLTNFSTATSPDVGRTISVSPVSESVPGVDRQWIAFLDDKTAFLTYNQLARGKTVQKSVDAGLTYDLGTVVSNESGRIGQIRAFVPKGKTSTTGGVVYFPYQAGNDVKLALSTNSGTTWTTCTVATGSVPPTAGFVTSDNDTAGNIYTTWTEAGRDYATYLNALRYDRLSTCKNGARAATTKAYQVNREGVATTVMPWVAALGQPGRVAVAFYGTRSVGNPNLGAFKASWYVYVTQSIDFLSAKPTFDQVQATTHPFHYDSICLTGLSCDLSVPAGDRSLVDYFTMEYNRRSGKLNIVYSNTAKRPGDAEGYVSQPTVLVQTAGPSNGGGTVRTNRKVLTTGSADPAGDALSQYSAVGARVLDSVNSKALDLRKVDVRPTQRDFTVTLRLADLSDAALQQALQDNAPATGLTWIFRWVNGYQPCAVSVHWDPATGFRAGYDSYFTERTAGGTVQKYPGAMSLGDQLKVDQRGGTLTVRVPSSVLKGLHGPTGDGQRPLLEKAVPGTRFYDGFAGSFADVTTSVSAPDPTTGGTAASVESYLYPADNAPTFDFALLGRNGSPVRSQALASDVTPLSRATGVGGTLAATGMQLWLAWAAAVALGAGLVLRRRAA